MIPIVVVLRGKIKTYSILTIGLVKENRVFLFHA